MGKVERYEDRRVLRGSCWDYGPEESEVASRVNDKLGARAFDLGVRFARRRSALERLVDGPREVSDEQG